jgi:Ni/Fe-hydrogenase subunit HybB-like protein
MNITLRELSPQGRGYFGLLGMLGAIVLVALGAVAYMEHHGHVVTGMNNQIVWGLPHVFAVFLVVAASGALNVASMASVFGKTELKPLAPLSGVLALALLLGGLIVLLLDLGRPDRLIIAMTHFNFRSIFAWNIFLYSGFMVLVVAYLWTQLEQGMGRYTAPAGMAAFLWRMALTTGTGSIFGFLVARQAYDSALLAPFFIALSLSYGLAIFMLVLMLACQSGSRPIDNNLMARMARLQIIFVAASLYFVLVYHMTNLYFAKHQDFARFVLLEGGAYTVLFWLGQVFLGSVLPIMLLLRKDIGEQRWRIATAAVLIIVGGFAQMYVTIIGGQAFPLIIFPGHEISSTFDDGTIARYVPSMPEFLLGLGGMAIAGLVVMVTLRVLRILPDRLDHQALSSASADAATDMT